MNAAKAEQALIFAWDHVRRVPLVLPGFVLLSFAVHFGTFFLFRVVYPQQASLPVPPPPVTVLDPTRPDHQALLRWAEAEDLTPSTTQATITDRLLEVPYRPSYAKTRTAPLTLPEQTGHVQYPPARDPLALIRSVEPKSTSPSAAPAGTGTRVVFSGELAARMKGTGALKLSATSPEPLEPAEYLVGVTDRGEVRFVVLQRSSGSNSLDSEAADHLSHLQLEHGTDPITWGRVTVHWGADAYAPAPQ